ncbi:hypothetical protein VIGAN_09076100 [Vigna angularis var. angularis]|uniref:Uncharacterized protein n=1 Tax=Vigna angularis var. angularis TaxID=157739 RepID=A0A0S3SWV5_PHAAN|nr:hypothetical protein VIGAN_09076100 [Vigna angularis var. angularis]
MKITVLQARGSISRLEGNYTETRSPNVQAATTLKDEMEEEVVQRLERFSCGGESFVTIGDSSAAFTRTTLGRELTGMVCSLKQAEEDDTIWMEGKPRKP